METPTDESANQEEQHEEQDRDNEEEGDKDKLQFDMTQEEAAAVELTGLTLQQLGAADTDDLKELFEEKNIKGSNKILIKAALKKIKPAPPERSLNGQALIAAVRSEVRSVRSEVRSVRSEVRSVRSEFRSELNSRFGEKATPTTLAHLGERCRKQLEALPEKRPSSGPAALSKSIAKFSDEYHMNALLTPCLRSLFETEDVVLVNCEYFTWLQLESLKEGEPRKLKPDFLVCHRSFYEAKTPKNNKTLDDVRKTVQQEEQVSFRFGVLADHRLRDSVLLVLEAKAKDLKDEDRGKMIVYLTNLCRGRRDAVARGLLYNAHTFELLTCNSSSQLARVVSNWTEPGSAELLRRACVSDAWTDVCQAACQALKVTAVDGGFLGAGGMARVITVGNGHENDLALKVVLAANIDKLQGENERNKTISEKARKYVLTPVDFWKGGGVGAAMLLPKGTPLVQLLTADTSKNMVRQVVRLLADLHNAGVIHGDPRLHNVVQYNGRLTWIDLVDASTMAIPTSYQSDWEILLESILERLALTLEETVKVEICSCSRKTRTEVDMFLRKVLGDDPQIQFPLASSSSPSGLLTPEIPAKPDKRSSGDTQSSPKRQKLDK